MKSSIVILGIVLLALIIYSTVRRKGKINPPDNILNNYNAAFQNKAHSWSNLDNNTWLASMEENDQFKEVIYNSEGTLLETRIRVEDSDYPHGFNDYLELMNIWNIVCTQIILMADREKIYRITCLDKYEDRIVFECDENGQLLGITPSENPNSK